MSDEFNKCFDEALERSIGTLRPGEELVVYRFTHDGEFQGILKLPASPAETTGLPQSAPPEA